MNMVFQDPSWVMIIGMGHPSGLTDVPDATFIRSMPAAFIPVIFMPGMFIPGMELCPNRGMASRIKPTVLKITRLLRTHLQNRAGKRDGRNQILKTLVATDDKSGGENAWEVRLSVPMNE